MHALRSLPRAGVLGRIGQFFLAMAAAGSGRPAPLPASGGAIAARSEERIPIALAQPRLQGIHMFGRRGGRHAGHPALDNARRLYLHDGQSIWPSWT